MHVAIIIAIIVTFLILLVLVFAVANAQNNTTTPPVYGTPPPVNNPIPPPVNNPLPPPVNNPPPPTIVDKCNKTACNDVMRDYIVDKYWRFDDSKRDFAVCSECESRGFNAPMDIRINNGPWITKPDRQSAYDAVKFI